MDANKVIEKAEKQIRDNGYNPFALWYSHDKEIFVITTRDMDLSRHMTFIKKYDQNNH